MVVRADGGEAWAALQADDAPPVAILDWMMPEMDGVEVCRRVRALPRSAPAYLILLTARDRPEDLVGALDAGADDYVVKPFNREELRARLGAGLRVARLQRALAERVRDLEQTLGQVRQLQGLLPICAWCKKVRNEGNYWQQVEVYMAEHSEATFSHGICPECRAKHVQPKIDALKRERQGG